MRISIAPLVMALLAALNASAAAGLQWQELPPVPDAIGFAGPFAGVAGNALLLAGGANFPGLKPWEGGSKTWHDSVFVLEKPDGKWRTAGRLPVPLGYGVSVSHKRGLVCIGGSDARQHLASAFVLRWTNGLLQIEKLPPQPQASANFSGALLGDTVYVFGGIASPDSTTALSTCFSLSLAASTPTWNSQPPMSGPGRMLAVAGSMNDSFYVVGGAALKPGPDGKPVRDGLRDAWRFTPGKGWTRLANLPRAVIAAPSPAPVLDGRLLVLGGDDGIQANTAPDSHKGFPREVLAYEPIADRWEILGALPFSLVTTPAVLWEGRVVLPGGEVKPGIRSTQVWSGVKAGPAPR